ncbi:hypothetical protein H3C65_03430 [Patescibacteria group bacterium]|nr:hypothetical protein [Patescibacteria group bacterium]
MNFLAFRQFIKGSNPVVCAREGWGKGYSFFFLFFSPAAVRKNALRFPAGGQKGRGFGGRNFCPSAFRAEGTAGVGNGSFLLKQEDKARKIRYV